MYVKNYSNALQILSGFLVIGALLFWLTHPSKDTLLAKAAANGDTNEAAAFLRAGANVNSVIGDGKRSPLIISIQTGHLDMAKFLMRHGADSNYRDSAGKTAADYARESAWTNSFEIFSNH